MILWTSWGLTILLLLACALLGWRLQRQHEGLLTRLEGLEEAVHGAAERVVERLEASRQREKEEEARRLEGLPIGSFVPTEEAQAEMERVVRHAEDRFIPAQGPIRFSSRPSPPSGRRSSREPWRPPGRSSGSA